MNRISVAICMLVALFIAGCASTTNSMRTSGNTKAEKRQAIQTMKNDALSDLYKQKPGVKADIASAPGYAVFSNVNINVILASFGGGYGVAKNNKTGKQTYMKMGEVGVGFGMGAKDFRAVFVFHSVASMNRFINHGWAFGAEADATAKAGDKGAALAGEITVDDITIYQLTETGLALQATIRGTKYWKDDSLN